MLEGRAAVNQAKARRKKKLQNILLVNGFLACVMELIFRDDNKLVKNKSRKGREDGLIQNVK